MLSQTDKSISLPYHKWKSDLSITPDAGFWTQISKNIYLMTKNSDLQLIQYKVLHRFHFTAQKMAKMGFGSDTCSHCMQNTPDTYTHAVWLCTPIYQFWVNVTDTLSTILGCHIPATPSLCILGDTSVTSSNTTDITFLLVALTIAQKTILMNWKSRKKVNISHWKNLLTDYISLDDPSTLKLNDTQDTPSPWSSFLTYLQI